MLRIVLVVLPLSACSDVRSPTQSPTTPTSTTSPATTVTTTTTRTNGANWTADATVLASTGQGCGWGIAVGETRQGVLWRITQAGSSVTLDEDTPNDPTDDIPYTGSVNGTQFTATYVQAPSGVCQFRGGELSGSFSADGLHFDAMETLTWGPTGNEARVQRRWMGSRL